MAIFRLYGPALCHLPAAAAADVAQPGPARAAGLGFLTVFPSIFTGFTFAISCVVSSGMLKELSYKAHSPDTVWLAIAAWLIVCVAWFVGPLLVFVGPLSSAQEKAMFEFGRYATRHHLSLGERLAAEASHEDEARRAAAPDFLPCFEPKFDHSVCAAARYRSSQRRRSQTGHSGRWNSDDPGDPDAYPLPRTC